MAISPSELRPPAIAERMPEYILGLSKSVLRRNSGSSSSAPLSCMSRLITFCLNDKLGSQSER
ncbi:hypothetical protein D3C87_2012910 [compost metagenome]